MRLEPLTADERQQLEAWRASQWVPQRALRYAWARVDAIHGRGGSMVYGRPRRPEDLDTGDGWSLTRFLAALDADREDIEAFTMEHPEQGSRLREWVAEMEAIGQQREHGSQPATGEYYEALRALGYDSQARFDNEESGT